MREDSSTWRAVVRRGEALVRYRVVYPSAVAATSPTNRAFLRETGGLLDGPATYLYLLGHTLAPAHVTFDLPAGWQIAGFHGRAGNELDKVGVIYTRR